MHRYTKKPYEGFYMETAEGKYFAGKNPLQLQEELLKIDDYKVPLHNNIGQTINNSQPIFTSNVAARKYHILKPRILSRLKDTSTIGGNRTIPTKKDYENGYFIRYFSKRINDSFGYKEINYKTFSKIKKEKDFDTNLYEAGHIKWSLKDDNWVTNGQQIDFLKKSGFPNLRILFPNLIEYQQKTLHNIENRFYPDNEPIPATLPPAYGLPKKLNQMCGNCVLNQQGKCSKWNANIRTNYWCKSWYPSIVQSDFSLYAVGNLPFEQFLNNYASNLPIYGCTNPNASNYNSAANTDDGSCIELAIENPSTVANGPIPFTPTETTTISPTSPSTPLPPNEVVQRSAHESDF